MLPSGLGTVLLGTICGFFLFALPATADHTYVKVTNQKPVLWAEFLPGGTGEIFYSLCKFDPDGLPRNNDGDEYIPSEYLTGIGAWDNFLTVFSPLHPVLTRVASDLPPSNGECSTDGGTDLRVAAQTGDDGCVNACFVYASMDVGSYNKILSADVRVQDGFWQNAGQWKQHMIIHELGHSFGLGDHPGSTQCSLVDLRAGLQSYLIMSQYNVGVLNPCVDEPTIPDVLGSACTAYGYRCDDANTFFGLVFGPSPVYRDNSPTYVWLLAEMLNVYDWDNLVQSTVVTTPSLPAGCSFGPWHGFLPGTSLFTTLAGERRYVLYRGTVQCGPTANTGVYPITFRVCNNLTSSLDLWPGHECAAETKAVLVFN